MNKQIYIIRHGQTEYNRQGIVQGSGVDTSLNETGRRQALAFHAAYGHLPFEAVITSRLKRTRETVAPFLEKGLPWEQFAELNEVGWGIMEGQKSTPETHASYRLVVDAWRTGDLHAAIEGGESAFRMQDRLGRFVEHLAQRPEKLLLVCSHGRAMRALMCLLVGEPITAMDRFRHDNTGLWLVQQEQGRFSFLKENDLSHLD